MFDKITERQMVNKLIISRIGTIITNMSIIHIGEANQDTWMILLFSIPYIFLTSLPILFLSSRFSDLTLIQYMEKIFGKVIGKIIGMLYVITFARIVVFFFYVSIQMIRSAFMMEVPPIVVITILAAICIYISTRKIETLGMASELSGPIAIMAIIIFIALGFSKIDFNLLLPIYKDSTFWGINIGALEISILFNDVFILSMLLPNLENKKDMGKIAIKSNIYSIMIIIIMVIATQGSLGVEQAKHLNFPFLTYIRIVRTYSIFERIESVFLIVWIIIVLSKIIDYLYIASYGFKQIFGAKDIRKFVYIIAILTSIITYYLANINSIIATVNQPNIKIDVYHGIFKIGIPLVAIIVYFFRRRSFNKEEGISD